MKQLPRHAPGCSPWCQCHHQGKRTYTDQKRMGAALVERLDGWSILAVANATDRNVSEFLEDIGYDGSQKGRTI